MGKEREHDFHLQNTLQRVRQHGLTLYNEKCLFNFPEIQFFGMVLSKDGIAADETKIQAIKKLKGSGNIEELRSFLDLATYLESFMASFADMIHALRKLL